MPNFCRLGTRSIKKIQQSPWSMYVDFWPKILLLRTPKGRNSITLLTLLVIIQDFSSRLAGKPVGRKFWPSNIISINHKTAIYSVYGMRVRSLNAFGLTFFCAKWICIIIDALISKFPKSCIYESTKFFTKNHLDFDVVWLL